MVPKNTEQKILNAAEVEFQEKGYNGARMRAIADKAGINKGLLHYYFKTKDALFEAIFNMAKKKVVAKIHNILELDIPLEKKIDLIVDSYISQIIIAPDLPRFVINELNKNPEKFIGSVVNKKVRTTFKKFKDSIEAEINDGRIKPINPHHLIMDVISLIIFPFIGRPMLQVVFGADNNEFNKLLKERGDHIKGFIRTSII